MDHEVHWKFFLNFRDYAAYIMNSLRNILGEDLDKHNLWLECFAGNAYEQYTTIVTNIQVNKDNVTNKCNGTDLNAVVKFILPKNDALK